MSFGEGNLHECISELEAENAELSRAMNRAAGKWARVDAENAQLRELVRDMHRTLSAMCRLNRGIYMVNEGLYDERCKALGIEVEP